MFALKISWSDMDKFHGDADRNLSCLGVGGGGQSFHSCKNMDCRWSGVGVGSIFYEGQGWWMESEVTVKDAWSRVVKVGVIKDLSKKLLEKGVGKVRNCW